MYAIYLFVGSSYSEFEVDGVGQVHQSIRLVSDVEGHVAQLPTVRAVEGGGCCEAIVDQTAWRIARDDQGRNHVGPTVRRKTCLRKVGCA